MTDRRLTRNYVDALETSTLTKQIDEYINVESPFEKSIDVSNFTTDLGSFYEYANTLRCDSLSENAVLKIDCNIRELLHKDVKSLKIHFRISSDKEITLRQIGIDELTETYKPLNLSINGAVDVDETLDISDISNSTLFSLIDASRFHMFIEISTIIMGVRVEISEVSLIAEFEKMLQDEIDAVHNRYDSKDIELNIDGVDINFDYKFGLSGIDDSIDIHTFLEKTKDGE